MLKRYSSFLIFLLGLGIYKTLAQEPVFRHYSTPEGLPSPETYMAMQDSEGYMWIATDHGVSRFDGYEFETFTTDNGLNGNTVFTTYEDYKGRIWFCTFEAGLSYYYKGEIKQLVKGGQMENWQGLNVPYSIYVDRGDTVWLGFKQMVNYSHYVKVHPNGDFIVDSLGADENITGFVKRFRSGDILVNGYPRFDKNLKLYIEDSTDHKFFLDSEKTNRGASFHNGLAVFKRADGDILLVYMGTLYLWSESGIEELVRFKESTHLGLLEDKKRNIWISLANGGVLFYPRGDFEHPQIWLKDILVSWITEDAEGGIWITTHNDGVYYTSSIDVRALSAADYFKNQRLLDFVGKGDTLLVMLKKGLVTRLIHQNEVLPDVKHKQVFTDFCFKVGWMEKRPYVTGRHNGTPNWVYFDLARMEPTKIFHGGRSDGIKLNDTLTLIIGRDASLAFLNLETGERFNYPPLSSNKYLFWCAYGNLQSNWLGGMRGLYRYNYPKNKLEHYKPEEELLNIRIKDIKKLGDLLLLATSGKGLVIVDGDKVWNISTIDGFPSNICNSIVVDSVEKEVWVSTNKGICRIKGLDWPGGLYTLRNYDFLSSTISQRVKSIYLMDSLVWALSDDGIIYFNKNSYELSMSPQVHISNFEINHNKVVGKEKKELSWKENNIHIGFKGISFRSVKKIRYKYRMLGLDDNWRYMTGTSINYSNLNPGPYKFQVYAQNAEGIWSEKMACMAFRILPPWWKNPWVIFAEVLLVTVLLVLAFYTYWKRQKKRSETEHKINQLKLQALQAQMNPHFIFNVLGAIQSFIISKDSITAQEYLASFASLVRTNLDHSVRAWVSLEEEISLLKTYLKLEKMRFEKPFSYSFEIDEQIEINKTYVPTMLLQPFVENSIIHGISPAQWPGTIHITIKKKDNYLECIIIDNGIGRKNAAVRHQNGKKLHRSYGIDITKERIELFKSKKHTKKALIKFIDLKDKNGEANGTKVIVMIPYQKETYNPANLPTDADTDY